MIILSTGQVGGGHYAHTGASVNYVCLPNDPDVAQPLKPHCDYDLIYGAEYQIGAYNQPQGMRSGIENRDAACAVCLAKSKMASILIPGKIFNSQKYMIFISVMKEWSRGKFVPIFTGYNQMGP